MAGHAPKLHPDGNRLIEWLEELSDTTLAALMLGLAVGIGGVIYLIDVSYFG